MRIASLLRWSLLGIVLLLGAGIAVAYSRGQFAGQTMDGPPIVLVGGRIYDPISDSLGRRVSVTIAGRAIVSVSRVAAVPEGARVLDVQGLTLLPGFIDSHVRLTGIAPDRSGHRTIGWLPYFWKFVRKFPDRRRDLIQAGVTTVKSHGDPYPWITRLAEKIERHELAGPRIYASGPTFTTPGGDPLPRLRRAGQGDTSFIAQVTRQIADTTAARLAVVALGGGTDFVSAVVRAGDPSGLGSDLLAAIVRTADGLGLATLARVEGVADLQEAFSRQARGAEYIPGEQLLPLTTLRRLQSRPFYVDPLLEVVKGTATRAATVQRARSNVRSLHEAGVPIIAGSGAPELGIDFGRGLHAEMRNLVAAGLTPAEAIAAATSVAAEQLGLSDRLGSITPGKLADIVAVAGDPGADIRAAADIRLVIADGQVLYDRLDRRHDRPRAIALHAPQRP